MEVELVALREMTIAQGLESAREAAGLTQDRLRDCYKTATGESVSEKTLRSWLKGDTQPRLDDYNVLAQVINDHFASAGKPDRLPYILFVVDDEDSGSSRITFQLPNGKAYMAWFNNPRLAPGLMGASGLELVG